MRSAVSGQPASESRRRWLTPSAWLFAFLGALLTSSAAAQELTPRLYWPAPKGTQALVVGFGHQRGDVVTDPSLPVTGVESRINALVLAYQQTLDWFGRTTNLQVELPFTDATTVGLTEDLPALREVRGFGDLSATLSVNLLGAPSMNLEEFQAFRGQPRPIVAFRRLVTLPRRTTGRAHVRRGSRAGSRWGRRLDRRSRST